MVLKFKIVNINFLNYLIYKRSLISIFAANYLKGN